MSNWMTYWPKYLTYRAALLHEKPVICRQMQNLYLSLSVCLYVMFLCTFLALFQTSFLYTGIRYRAMKDDFIFNSIIKWLYLTLLDYIEWRLFYLRLSIPCIPEYFLCNVSISISACVKKCPETQTYIQIQFNHVHYQ